MPRPGRLTIQRILFGRCLFTRVPHPDAPSARLPLSHKGQGERILGSRDSITFCEGIDSLRCL